MLVTILLSALLSISMAAPVDDSTKVASYTHIHTHTHTHTHVYIYGKYSDIYYQA